jgi:glyceraldehyde 3-phosphate dehydrogenase
MAQVAINGLGRIGRAVLNIILDTPDLELAAINDLIPPDNLAYLLQYDTVYGRSPHRIEANDSSLVIDGRAYPVLGIKDPLQLPWGDMGIDIVLECTGIFRKIDDLRKHLQAGAQFVILSAPAKSPEVVTVVHGVNDTGNGDTRIVSCASCTTNSITPVVEIMSRRIGVEKALMTTIHAYTSTQGIVDGPSSKLRRGRAAAVNIVPTTTGAAEATTKALPDLEGKFDGVAVRVPVPVGSISDMTFLTMKKTSVEEINSVFREEAAGDRYDGVLGVTEDPIVSSDIIRDSHASVVDLSMTRVVDGDLVKVMAWYDNEWGYSSQMIREARRIASRISVPDKT